MKKLFAVLVLVVAPLLMGASYLAFKQTINISCTASRTTGAAPLYVHYDCTATTASSLTSQPFHDIQYTFNYGDTAAPTAAWGYGNRTGNGSKNTDYGAPVGSHIYETAGTYTGTVTAYYNGVSVQANLESVTVTAANTQWANAATECISSSGTFTGCPSGATQRTSGVYTRTYVAGTRYLYRCDESFTGAGSTTISSAGPGLVGAFDSSGFGCNGTAKPILTMATESYAGLFGLAAGASDWRFVDLDIRRGASGPGGNYAFTINAAVNRVTILRLATDAGRIISNDSTGTQPSEWAVHDSVASNITDHGLMLWSSKSSFRGNAFTAGNASPINVTRLMGPVTTILSNNTYGPATGAGGYNALTLRTHEYPSTDPTPQYNVVADNFVDVGQNFLGISIAPCSSGGPCSTDPLVTDTIIERNYVRCTDNLCGAPMALGSAVNPTVRNNIFQVGGTAVARVIYIVKDGHSDFNGSGARIYNNSVYVASTQSGISIVNLAANTSGAVVRNNLAYAPNATSPVMISDSASGTTTCATCNTDNTQLKNTAPTGWTIPPTQASHFAITGGYAVDGGVAVPVWSDYNAATRTGTYDLGALNP